MHFAKVDFPLPGINKGRINVFVISDVEIYYFKEEFSEETSTSDLIILMIFSSPQGMLLNLILF